MMNILRVLSAWLQLIPTETLCAKMRGLDSETRPSWSLGPLLRKTFPSSSVAFKSKIIKLAPSRSLTLFNGKFICHRASRTRRDCRGSEREIIYLSLMIPRVTQSCRTLKLSLCFPICLMRTPLGWQYTGSGLTTGGVRACVFRQQGIAFSLDPPSPLWLLF